MNLTFQQTITIHEPYFPTNENYLCINNPSCDSLEMIQFSVIGICTLLHEIDVKLRLGELMVVQVAIDTAGDGSSPTSKKTRAMRKRVKRF